jgi:hypothetical protein
MHKHLPMDDNSYYLIHIGSASNKHPLFRSIFAYDVFLTLFQEIQQETQRHTLAYALFADEVVLLSQVLVPIEHWLDAWILAYSRWSHRVYEHQGSVFASHFTAVQISQDVMDQAIVYVHSTPIIKGLQPQLDYPYSSHHLYQQQQDTWVNIQTGLSYFHINPHQASLRYQHRANTQLNLARKHQLSQCARIGNHPSEARWVTPGITSVENKHTDATTSLEHPPRFDHLSQFDPQLDQVVLFIQQTLEIPAEAILGFDRHRRTADARAMAAWLALQEEVPKSAIEQYFQLEWPLIEGHINNAQSRLGQNTWQRLKSRWRDEKPKQA